MPHRIVLRCCAPALLCVCQGLDAEERPETEPTALERIVITATRWEVTALDAPAAVQTLSEDDLRVHRQARTLPEALKEMPGVRVQKTSHGQGSPFLRGFTGFRTLLLVDGIRVNNSTFRDGPNQYWGTVDPLSIGTLELVKGPGSVLYGSDAVGGTVNVLGATAWDADPGIEANAYTRYSSGENALVGRPEVSWRGTHAALRAGVSIKDFGDLEGGEDIGVQPQTAYSELDGDLRLDYAPTEDSRWVFAYQYVSQDDAWRTHSTIYGISFAGTTIGDELRRSLDQYRRLAYVQYQGRDAGPFDALSVSLSHHEQDETQLRIRGDGRFDDQGADVGTVGVAVQLTNLAGIARFDYGLEYYVDEVDSFRVDYNSDGSLRGEAIQGPVADDASYDLLGVYAQAGIPTGAFEWQLGARYTYAAADAEQVADPVSGEAFSMSDDWDAVVASARTTWTPPSGAPWRLFGGVSQAFRAPNLSDLTRLDTARSNEIETPVSAGLDPERFLSYEIGVKTQTERASAQLAWYYTDLEDLIVRTPTGRIVDGLFEVTKQNSSGGHATGFEAEGLYRFAGPWTAFANFTWMDGETATFPTSDPIEVDEPLDRLMPITWVAGLRWEGADATRRIELVAEHADAGDELSTRDMQDTQRIPPDGTPSWTVWHARSAFRLGSRLWLAAAIENIADEDYRIHGSGLNEPGRSFTLTFEWGRQ
jgi:hemoglobin/transferrin/lactoferrin receptor protein